MIGDQTTHGPIPLLRSSEEQVAKLRRRLEHVFTNVALAHDVAVVCAELGRGDTADFNAEIAHVLQRCVADKLRFQIQLLTNVIERLGGNTAFHTDEVPAEGRA